MLISQVLISSQHATTGKWQHKCNFLITYLVISACGDLLVPVTLLWSIHVHCYGSHRHIYIAMVVIGTYTLLW